MLGFLLGLFFVVVGGIAFANGLGRAFGREVGNGPDEIIRIGLCCGAIGVVCLLSTFVSGLLRKQNGGKLHWWEIVAGSLCVLAILAGVGLLTL